jgi:CubicO group peptidase (beta-lactamase class C family)
MHDHEMVETVAALPPLFPPGSGFHYSSPGYVLLADIVERISGQSYPTYLEDQVFSPLGLSATFAGNAGDRPDVATGHVGGRPAPSFELDHTGKGAGDVWSTAVDLDRWVRAVADGRLLGSASTAAMLAPQVPTPAGRHYGYGWFVGSLGRHRACFHTGDNHGFVSLNAWLPDAQLRVTLLSNDDRTTFTVSSDDPPCTSGSDVRTTPGAVDLLRSLQVSDSRG